MIELPDRMPDLRRLKALYGVLMVACGVLVARLWYLQIVKGPELAERSRQIRTRTIRRVAPRGTITDTKGRTLATTHPQYVISVLPDDLKKNPELLPNLAALLKIPEADLKERIAENRTTPFDPVPVLEQADFATLAKVEEQKNDLPGVFITQDPLRYYTEHRLCTHLLGFTRPITAEMLEKMRDAGYRGGDYVGLAGVERFYEPELRGKDGGQKVEVDAKGRIRRNLEEIPPTPGYTLRLNIDLDLQKVAYDALMEELARGHPGAAVALNPKTGAVLAMVSLPTYDPNEYGKIIGKLTQDPLTPLVHRAVDSRYPAGSTMKIITAAAGLRSGTSAIYTGDSCGGAIRVAKRVFHCNSRRGHGGIGLERALGVSCNIYFWHVGLRAGTDKMVETAHRFGLGERPEIDIPTTSTAKGRVPTPEWKRKVRKEPWYPGDLMNMAIGQGDLEVTPLQLANFTAALANGGKLLRPQLMKELVDISGPKPVVVRRMKPEFVNDLGLTPEQRNAIIAGMRRVMVSGGTGARSALPNVAVAGKTGSADSHIRRQKVTNSLFTCFAPLDNPQIVVAVIVEDGGHGSDSAAPIARRILKRFFRVEGEDVLIGGRHGSD